ncbi:lysine-specific demethylase 3B isoform X1 [Chelonus insularis]|uniref:lysine-specific demethylase 3B isoform X1 n=1 Tax=Chelonus insularis TaxID=460826 RepID=UPI001588B4BB|nr:lysine-specific demethylase 3B isoform X1 [Chelonus insularis]
MEVEANKNVNSAAFGIITGNNARGTTYGDSSSDSGLSSLRSTAGSGDERSGSRGSTLSAEDTTTTTTNTTVLSLPSTTPVVTTSTTTPAKIWHVNSVQHSSLMMAYPSQGSIGETLPVNSTPVCYQNSVSSHQHSSTITSDMMVWKPPRFRSPLSNNLLATSGLPRTTNLHNEVIQEREKMMRERRGDMEVRAELEIKRDREKEVKMEREKLEKQRAAEQAVHKHFEESLRLAQQKRDMQYASLGWNSIIPLPPHGSRSHGAPPPSSQSNIPSHGHHHHSSVASHSVLAQSQQLQQQKQQQHQQQEQREKRDPVMECERDIQGTVADRIHRIVMKTREENLSQGTREERVDQREKDREHLVVTTAAPTDRIHRIVMETRDDNLKYLKRGSNTFYSTPPPMPILRPSTVLNKVTDPPRSAYSRIAVPQNIGESSRVVIQEWPARPPSPSMYAEYEEPDHDIKVDNDHQHKSSKNSISGGNLSDRSEHYHHHQQHPSQPQHHSHHHHHHPHHNKEMLSNHSLISSDHKNSVIVKNDQQQSRNGAGDTQKIPYSSSPKMMAYPNVQSTQLKPVAYEYRSPTQSPHHHRLHHHNLDSSNIQMKGLSPTSSHHRAAIVVTAAAVGPFQSPQSSSHSPHLAVHNRQPQSPHQTAPHLTASEQPLPRHLSNSRTDLPYVSSSTSLSSSSPSPSHSYLHHRPPNVSPTPHYATQTTSKPKVSSPAPPHIYGKPTSGIMTGTPVCRNLESSILAPLPLTSKISSPSYQQQEKHQQQQQVARHHGVSPSPPSLPPPAHTSRSIYDSRGYSSSLPVSKLSQPPPPPPPLPPSPHQMLHGSPSPLGPPTLSKSSVPYSLHVGNHNQLDERDKEQDKDSQSLASANISFQTQPLDLGVERSDSPKRKASASNDHTNQAISSGEFKKRRTEEPQLASTSPASTAHNNAGLFAQSNHHHYQTAAQENTVVSLASTPSSKIVKNEVTSGNTNFTTSVGQSSTSNVTYTAVPTLTVNESTTSTNSTSNSSSTDIEKSNSPVSVAVSRPPSRTNYPVHKLKKAWLQRHSGEDGTTNDDLSNINVTNNDSSNASSNSLGANVNIPESSKITALTSLTTTTTTVTTASTTSSLMVTTTTSMTTSTTTATASTPSSGFHSTENSGSMTNNSQNKNKSTGGKAGKKSTNKELNNGHTIEENSIKNHFQEDSSSSDVERKSPSKRKPPSKVKRKKGAVLLRKQQAAVEEQRRKKDDKQQRQQMGSGMDGTGGGSGGDSSNESEIGSATSDTASEQLCSSSAVQSTTKKNSTTNSNNLIGNGSNISNNINTPKEPRKRGRRPKNSKGNDVGGGSEDQQPRQKKERKDDCSNNENSPSCNETGGGNNNGRGNGEGSSGNGGSSGGNSSNNGKNNPFCKPPISQLKKTGDSWLQDLACCEVAPKLAKCRECRYYSRGPLSRLKNQKVFCRFYAFRRLRYTKNGQLAIAGFSDPHKDASKDDIALWLPSNHHQKNDFKDSEKMHVDNKEVSGDWLDLTYDMAYRLICQVGDQFCDLVRQEKEALSEHMADDGTVAWKRVVQGVRELCDVCETTLFNYHWVCAKCGFAVCIDCFKGRKNGSVTIWGESGKDRDEFSWLLCTNRHTHAPEKLMLTQIIAGDSLSVLGEQLHQVRAEWGIPQHCNCSVAESSISKIPVNEALKDFIKSENQDIVVTNDDKKNIGVNNSKAICEKKGSDGASGGQDKNSPLNWLADVALQNQDNNKDCNDSSSRNKAVVEILSSDSDEDEEDHDGNYSTLRELLIRPSHKSSNGNIAGAGVSDTGANSDGGRSKSSGSGNNDSRSNSPTNNGGSNNQVNSSTANSVIVNNVTKAGKKSNMDKLDEVISSVIEHTVKKDREDSGVDDSAEATTASATSATVKGKPPCELKHFVRRYKWTEKGREPLPIRIMTLTESKSLYPNVPHSWLCDGKLLRLNDPQNMNNYKIFQDQWKRGQPVIVSDVSKSLNMELWHPDSFIRDFGDEKNDLINCMTGHTVPHQPMRKFWEGFEHLTKRLKDDKGNPMLLKLKDWPPGDDFAELLPSRFMNLMEALPLSEYTHRYGRLNLASRLPDCFVKPDLGPKMYNAYGSAMYPNKGTTNLHLDISDAVNVMVYVGIPKDGDSDEHIKEALRAIDEAGCDILTRRRVRDRSEAPGALWHIYAARDADKIRDLLNAVALERGARLEPHHDPIHDQSCYLDGPLRERLYREYGVEGYAIVQCLGDAVFVPAGAPHQVRNLHNCIKVAEDFVSPENVSHCFHLTQEFRALSDTHTNHEDKLQIKNIVYHAVKDSLTVLETAKDKVYDMKKEVEIKKENDLTWKKK